MRSLFIVACWILGLMSVAVGVLSVPFTLGFSLLGGIAGLVFFGGLAGFAEDLMETRKLVRLLYEQRDQSAIQSELVPQKSATDLISSKPDPLFADSTNQPEPNTTDNTNRWIIVGIVAFVGSGLIYALVSSIYGSVD